MKKRLVCFQRTEAAPVGAAAMSAVKPQTAAAVKMRMEPPLMLKARGAKRTLGLC